jgi:hypothetical protein
MTMTRTATKLSGVLAGAVIGLAGGAAHAVTYTGVGTNFFDPVAFLDPGKYRAELTVCGPFDPGFGTGLSLTHSRLITNADTGDFIDSSLEDGLGVSPLSFKRDDFSEVAIYVVPESFVQSEIRGGITVNVEHSYSGSLFVFLSSADGSPVSYVLEIEQLAAVPEPPAWATMVAGFGAAGALLRRRRVLA